MSMNTTINLAQLPADLQTRLDALRADIETYLATIDGFPEDGDVVIEASGLRKRPRKFALTHVRRVAKLEWDYEFVVNLDFLNVKGEMKPYFDDDLLEPHVLDPELLYERGSGESYRIIGKHVDFDLEIKPKAKK